MNNLVTITSQGQISIPVSIRRSMGLDKHNKAFIHQQYANIIIEPVRDLFSLGGSLRVKALKHKTMTEIRKIERNVAVSGFITK